MGGAGLWIRWSWRDLRHRWLLVVAIALVIALGTGAYAAFTGSATWRRTSNDLSFAAVGTHDLRARLAPGTSAPEGLLLRRVRDADPAGEVTSVVERLVLPTQLDVGTATGDDLLVTGQLVGAGEPAGTGAVDSVYVSAGRGLRPEDAGQPVAVLERNFAEHHSLPPQGELRVGGDRTLRWVGHGQAPEYFILTGEDGSGFFGQSTFGVLFTSLPTAQDVAGAPGQVNDVVLRVRDGADVPALRQRLEQALASGERPVSATVTTREEMPAHHLLYRDIDNDQKLWNVVAALMLGGAALAAFNLTGRVVDAQRREIGVGMALGVPRSALAVRPLLLGAQIAVLGVLLGLGTGAAVSALLADEFRSLLPLPVWDTSFQAGPFARAAGLGFVIPMLAVLWPVWRAVRVEPVEAIRVGHLAGRARSGGGLAHLARRLPFTRSTLRQMPVRNVLRTPRRTLLTALGVAATMTSLVAVFGMLDSFTRTVDAAAREVTSSAADRLSVQLAAPVPATSPELTAATSTPDVVDWHAALLLPAVLLANGSEVDVAVETVPDDAVWSPTITEGAPAVAPGEIVLAAEAAADLGLAVGDDVTVRHPQRLGDTAFRTTESTMRVVGLHPSPLRVGAYVDESSADMFGLSGAANVVQVVPAPGVAADELRRELLGSPLVTSAQPVTTATDTLRDAVGEFTAILAVAAGVTLLLALLIAFNASSIAVDERVRDNATMLAFGVPVRSLLGIHATESALTGLVGTLLGIAAGYAVLGWVTGSLLAETLPDVALSPALSWGTAGVALAVGIAAVGVAPLLVARRLTRVDLPAALRVVE